MSYFVDFSWRAEGHPLSTTQLEQWESIIRKAMGGPGWVVMRQVKGVWRVEEARLAGADGQEGPCAPVDRRRAVTDALRQHGMTVGD